MVHGSGEDNFHNALNLSAHTVAVITLYLLKIMSQRWNSYSKIHLVSAYTYLLIAFQIEEKQFWLIDFLCPIIGKI